MQNQKPGIHLTQRSSYMTPPLPKPMELHRPNSSTMLPTANMFKPKPQLQEMQSPIPQKHPMPKPLITLQQCNTPNRLSTNGQNSTRSQSRFDFASEVDVSIMELKEQMYKMGKTLYSHERTLNALRDSKLSNTTVSGSNVSEMITPLSIAQVTKIVQHQLVVERQHSHAKMLAAIDDLKREVSDKFVKKEDYQLNFFGELQDIRNKIHEGDKIVVESLRREIDSLKLISCDSLRHPNTKAQMDILDLHKQIETLRSESLTLKLHFQEQHQPFLTTNRRFNSPRLFRYRQTLQSLTPCSEPLGEQISINELIYHLDGQGYLLDNNDCYLTDSHNSLIQLEQRHLNLLHAHNMML